MNPAKSIKIPQNFSEVVDFSCSRVEIGLSGSNMDLYSSIVFQIFSALLTFLPINKICSMWWLCITRLELISSIPYTKREILVGFGLLGSLVVQGVTWDEIEKSTFDL